MVTVRRRRLLGAVIVFGLLAAACNGDDAQPATTTAPPPPATEAPTPTTASPPTTPAPAPPPPPPPTTTLPPSLGPQVLTLGLESGDLASYEGTVEVVTSFRGADGALFFGVEDADRGVFTTTTTGRHRLLALGGPSDGTLEIVEDYTAEEGTLVSVVGGERTIESLTRDDLLDFKPSSGPVLVDSSASRVAGRSGAPGVFAAASDPLAVAALMGPPLSEDAVDEGDGWTLGFDAAALGRVDIESTITGEEGGAGDDPLVHVLEFSGEATDLPIEVGLREALGAFGLNDLLQRMEAVVGNGVATVEVRNAVVDGEVRFDPALGIAVAYETSSRLSVVFRIDFGDVQWQWEVDSETRRSVELTELSGAAPFEIESILDRFDSDPFFLAASRLIALTQYDLEAVSDEEFDSVIGHLSGLRQSLFAGINILRVNAEDDQSVIAVAITNGGEFRGDPIVGEGLAEFLSASNPRSVRVGDQTAFRVSIDDEEWLFFNDETHLFLTIGSRDLSTAVMTVLATAPTPYLWQDGDCLDFRDDGENETPYAPFGLHGLRHCSVPHTYQVIHSEVLPEGPDARFPSDMTERSQMACGRAYHDLTGTTELESSIALIRYLPDEDEWEKGSRYLACMVYVSDAEGEVELSARINGTDPAYTLNLDAGVCLFGLDPVPCDSPHTSEIIAALDLPDGPDAPRPDPGELEGVITAQCEAAFADFSLGEGPGIVEVRDLTDVLTAWEYGARRYFCIAIAFGPDGFRLEITGTFSDGWEEAGDRVTA